MALSDELLANAPNNGLAAALRDNITELSRNEQVTFTRYVRMALPADGFVFWVNASLLPPSGLIDGSIIDAGTVGAGNSLPIQRPLPDGSIGIFSTPQATFPLGLIVQGSFHYATQTDQREDETLGINQVVFTTKTETQFLSNLSPESLWIGTVNGIQFAFSQRGNFYRAAGLNHYRGDAVYPALKSQIIDSASQISTLQVVSNSLPVWLQFTSQCPMYPSFLVPANLAPPYGAIHIDPAGTDALQAIPSLDYNSNHLQLCEDRVRITFYGLRNNQALDWQDTFYNFVANQNPNAEVIGVMGMPTPMRDQKRTQKELTALASAKVFECRVSYYQTRTQSLARQLIKTAFMTLQIGS